jgi:hypothetical protein
MRPFGNINVEMERSAFFCVDCAEDVPFAAARLGSEVRLPPGTQIFNWRSDWNFIAGFRTMLRTPESDPAAMTLSSQRSYSFADWLHEFGLLANRHVHDATPTKFPRSVWDSTPPTHATLFGQFPLLKGLFPAGDRVGAPQR